MKKIFFIAALCFAALPLCAQISQNPVNPAGGDSYSFSVTLDEIKDAFLGKTKKPVQIDPSTRDKKDGDAQDVKEVSPEALDPNAIEEMTRLAKSGNANFQYNLGRCYDKGLKVAQDYKQALYWYQKAAEQGHDKAANNLGCMYLDGRGVEQDYEKAAYWLELSAQKNDTLAILNLGCMYEDGNLGGSQNYDKAFEYYQKADKLGCAPAAYELGHCFEVGVGTKANAKKAFSFYKKSADAGYGPAACETGRRYLEGDGVKKDLKMARKYLEIAVKKGELKAAGLLGAL